MVEKVASVPQDWRRIQAVSGYGGWCLVVSWGQLGGFLAIVAG